MMVSKKDIHELEFTTIEEYFEYIVSSYINGQKEQAEQLISDLSKPQKKDAIDYLSTVYLHKEEVIEKILDIILSSI